MALVNLYLVRDNPADAARLFRRVGGPSNRPDIWIPRSETKRITKFPPTENPTDLRLCQIEIPDWLAHAKGLD
jgi:hypothetical protein